MSEWLIKDQGGGGRGTGAWRRIIMLESQVPGESAVGAKCEVNTAVTSSPGGDCDGVWALQRACPDSCCAAADVDARLAKRYPRPSVRGVAHRRVVSSELSGGRSRWAGVAGMTCCEVGALVQWSQRPGTRGATSKPR